MLGRVLGTGERRGTLRYGDCVLTADCVRGLDREWEGGREGERYVTGIVC